MKYNSFQKVANNIDIVFSKYANCEVLTEIYGKKLEQSKDEKLLRQVIKLFNKKECTNNPTYVTAVKEFHQISPTAQTAYYMGVISQKEGAYTEAMDYFNQALSMYQKQSDTIRTYLKIAEVLFGQKQYSAAREYAHKVLRMNPTNAEAYIFIGNLYALSGCSTEIPGAAYWAAADKFSKAMAITASLKDNDNKQKTLYEQAQKSLARYSAYFPKTETYFQRGFQKGQSYRVECWINETTVIR